MQEEHKHSSIKIRLSQGEVDAWKGYANMLGVNLSEWVRMACRNYELESTRLVTAREIVTSLTSGQNGE